MKKFLLSSVAVALILTAQVAYGADASNKDKIWNPVTRTYQTLAEYQASMPKKAATSAASATTTTAKSADPFSGSGYVTRPVSDYTNPNMSNVPGMKPKVTVSAPMGSVTSPSTVAEAQRNQQASQAAYDQAQIKYNALKSQGVTGSELIKAEQAMTTAKTDLDKKVAATTSLSSGSTATAYTASQQEGLVRAYDTSAMSLEQRTKLANEADLKLQTAEAIYRHNPSSAQALANYEQAKKDATYYNQLTRETDETKASRNQAAEQAAQAKRDQDAVTAKAEYLNATLTADEKAQKLKEANDELAKAKAAYEKNPTDRDAVAKLQSAQQEANLYSSLEKGEGTLTNKAATDLRTQIDNLSEAEKRLSEAAAAQENFRVGPQKLADDYKAKTAVYETCKKNAGDEYLSKCDASMTEMLKANKALRDAIDVQGYLGDPDEAVKKFEQSGKAAARAAELEKEKKEAEEYLQNVKAQTLAGDAVADKEAALSERDTAINQLNSAQKNKAEVDAQIASVDGQIASKQAELDKWKAEKVKCEQNPAWKESGKCETDFPSIKKLEDEIAALNADKKKLEQRAQDEAQLVQNRQEDLDAIQKRVDDANQTIANATKDVTSKTLTEEKNQLEADRNKLAAEQDIAKAQAQMRSGAFWDALRGANTLGVGTTTKNFIDADKASRGSYQSDEYKGSFQTAFGDTTTYAGELLSLANFNTAQAVAREAKAQAERDAVAKMTQNQKEAALKEVQKALDAQGQKLSGNVDAAAAKMAAADAALAKAEACLPNCTAKQQKAIDDAKKAVDAAQGDWENATAAMNGFNDYKSAQLSALDASDKAKQADVNKATTEANLARAAKELEVANKSGDPQRIEAANKAYDEAEAKNKAAITASNVAKEANKKADDALKAKETTMHQRGMITDADQQKINSAMKNANSAYQAANDKLAAADGTLASTKTDSDTMKRDQELLNQVKSGALTGAQAQDALAQVAKNTSDRQQAQAAADASMREAKRQQAEQAAKEARAKEDALRAERAAEIAQQQAEAKKKEDRRRVLSGEAASDAVGKFLDKVIPGF